MADDGLLADIVASFVARLPEAIAGAERAWADRDLGALARFAHWLGGTGGSLGFEVLTEPSRELERLAKAGDEAQVGKVYARLKGLAKRINGTPPDG